jgi:hypothetical protein
LASDSHAICLRPSSAASKRARLPVAAVELLVTQLSERGQRHLVLDLLYEHAQLCIRILLASCAEYHSTFTISSTPPSPASRDRQQALTDFGTYARLMVKLA